MTPKEFYQLLSESEPKIMKVPPVPIKIGESDILAAKMLLWLNEQMPENATQGDYENVLDSAKWWFVFWGSAHMAQSNKDEA